MGSYNWSHAANPLGLPAWQLASSPLVFDTDRAGARLYVNQSAKRVKVNMESFTYSDLLQRLDGFDAWLISIGLTPRPNDRIHEAIKVLRKADEASRKGRETGIYSDIQPGDCSQLSKLWKRMTSFFPFTRPTAHDRADGEKSSIRPPPPAG